MTKHIASRTSAVAWPTLLIAVLLGAAAVGGWQAPQTGSPPESKGGVTQVDEVQGNTLMAKRQQMMAAMREMDQKLKDLVAKMDAAKGDDKTDAIAAVVKELVTQRTQMSDGMMMHGRMMGHMMQHMMSMQGGMRGMMNRGGRPQAMPSLERCPLEGLTQEPGGSQPKQ